MILRSLEFHNFRQFHTGTVEFSTDEEKNVTVIHGQNGAGKTTILNAFKWLLYDQVEFTNRPDRLATEGVMAEADVGESVTVEVRLEFDHEGSRYNATRQTEYRKRDPSDYDGERVDDSLTVTIDDGTQTRQPGNPKNTLQQVIPERLSGLFFFDGEDIDELSQFDNREHIQEAIQNIMGLTILERATRHLESVASRFEDEAAKYGSDELAELIETKQDVESEIEELEQKRTDKERAIGRIEDEILELSQKLNQFEKSRGLQERREKFEDEIIELEQEIEQIETDIRAQINDNGFITVGASLIRDTATDINTLREDGDLPSRLSNEYLNTLLDAGECICGRPLEYDTKPYDQVASMRGDVSTDGVDQAALRLIGSLDQFLDRKEAFFEGTDQLIEKRGEKQGEIQKLEERVDDISGKLQDIETVTTEGLSVGELNEQREAKLAEKEELNQEIGKISEQIDQHEQKREDLEEQISQQESEVKKAELARRRQRVAQLVQQDIQDSFNNLKDTVRQWSDRRVRQTFSAIASKNYTAGINDNFGLEIHREDQAGERVEVDISTGERQIASLAFIGSLVKIAQDRYEDENDYEYFTGGIYPIVMDSPFGALDNTHRAEVSRVIPELGSQVVVLATDSQWEGPVKEQMAGQVGQRYRLNYQHNAGENNRPQTKISSEQVSVRGD